MKRLSMAFMLAAGLFVQGVAAAQDGSASGLWKTIDDQTGKPRSLVRVTEVDGEYRGTVERLFRGAGENPNPRCDKCEDGRKGQPVIGMTIITGMRRTGNEYSGGQILDPENGKNYRSRMLLSEDARKLDVRGFIGVPAFGRSQTWLRVE